MVNTIGDGVMTMKRMGRAFFRRDSITLAQDLLGRRLVRLLDGHRLACDIVETEAYLGIPDKAAHTFGGRRTARNEAMYHDGGHLYVYFTYGMHFCMNVVASTEDNPVAVLLRAGQPVEGLEIIRGLRPKARKDKDLCSGPGKLCQALAIDRQQNDLDLTSPDSVLFIEEGPYDRASIEARTVSGPRVGIGSAGEWVEKPLRFFLKDNPFVSRG